MEVPGKKAEAANRIESVINAWCEPCAGDDDGRQPAAGFCVTCKEYMCKTCLLCHRKSKFGKTHSILSSQDMPSSSVSPSVRGDEHEEEEITEFCPIHEKEVIKYICLDHNQLCCADCMLYTHKLCEQLRKISDVCADQSTVNEIYSVQERLDSLSTRVDDEIEKAARQNPVNEEQYQTQLQDIGKYTEEITNTLARLKTDFQTQAFNKKEKNKNKMTLIASECKKLKQEVELMKMELQSSSNLSKQFILIKKAENEIRRWEDKEKKIEASNHLELVVFDPDCLIKKLFSDIASLGAFKEEVSEPGEDYSCSSRGSSGEPLISFKDAFISSTSSRDRFNFSGEFENGLKLKVYEASITRLNVDVIVSAANDCLMHGDGVAKMIAVAAGYEFEKESRRYIDTHGYIPVSKNCVTKAGRLHYKGVIHAVGPQWMDYRNKVEGMDALYDCIWNILDACDKNGYVTVGMSAISAGIYGVPKELCADMYVKAAAEYSKMLKNEKRFPTELHIIDIDPTILHMVKDSFENWEKDPSSIDQRKTVPLYVNIHGGASNSFQRGKRNEESSRVNRKFDTGFSSPTTDFGSGSSVRKINASDFSCRVEKCDDETFRWGARAKVFKIDGKITAKIYSGSVEKVKRLDAIVCGVDRALKGYLADTLEREALLSYRWDLDTAKKKSHQINKVLQFKANNLGVKNVLYLVTERIAFAGEKDLREYKTGILHVLRKANETLLRKLAFPLIGSGTVKGDAVKLKLCCKTFLQAICDFCQETGALRVSELYLINADQNVTSCLQKTFEEAISVRDATPKWKSGMPKQNQDEQENMEIDKSDEHLYEVIKNQNDEGENSNSSDMSEDEKNKDGCSGIEETPKKCNLKILSA